MPPPSPHSHSFTRSLKKVNQDGQNFFFLAIVCIDKFLSINQIQFVNLMENKKLFWNPFNQHTSMCKRSKINVRVLGRHWLKRTIFLWFIYTIYSFVRIKTFIEMDCSTIKLFTSLSYTVYYQWDFSILILKINRGTSSLFKEQCTLFAWSLSVATFMSEVRCTCILIFSNFCFEINVKACLGDKHCVYAFLKNATFRYLFMFLFNLKVISKKIIWLQRHFMGNT